MKFSKLSYIIIPVSIILFGLLVYPTLYKYDKLEQKYPVKINRITGEAQILRGDGWVKSSDSKTYEEKFLQYKSDIGELIIKQNDEISRKVAASVKDDIILDLQEQIADVEEEITAYKDHKTDPNNSFTIGDTKDTVKRIMGTPSSVTDAGPYNTWFYGFSTVKFENGKVTGWSNLDDNLMIK